MLAYTTLAGLSPKRKLQFRTSFSKMSTVSKNVFLKDDSNESTKGREETTSKNNQLFKLDQLNK